ELVTRFMEIVSERTGYPQEMLDLNLDMEADLGIDSIKRVEILSTFRKLLPEAKQQQIEGHVEKLAGTKTLQGIIDWIREYTGGSPAESTPQQVQATVAPSTTNGKKEPVAQETMHKVPTTVMRGKIVAKELAEATSDQPIAVDGVVIIAAHKA